VNRDQIVSALLAAARSAVDVSLWEVLEPVARETAEELAREVVALTGTTKAVRPPGAPARFSSLRDLVNAYGGDERDRMVRGNITIEELRDAFDDAKKREAEITGAVLRFPAATLAAYGRRDRTKEQNARSIYEMILSGFVPLSSWGWSPLSETFPKAVERLLREATDETIRAYAEEKRRERERKEERRAAMSTPSTLAEYEEARRVRSLTPDETITYDELVADAALAKVRAERAAKTEERARYARASARPEGSAATATARVIAGEHTRDKYPIWTVVLDQRLTPAEFAEARDRAKTLGGYYSSFRGGGAVPGFVFRDEAKARTFASAYRGASEETAETPPSTVEETPEEAAAARLRDQAASLQGQAGETLEKDRLANTARRAAMAASVEWRAMQDAALAKRIGLVADAIAAGNERLWPVKQKTHVEELQRTLRRARNRTLREKRDRGERFDWEQEQQAPYLEKDLANVEYPVPEIYAPHVRSVALKVAERKGGKLAAKRLIKQAEGLGEDGYLRADDERTRDDLQAVIDALTVKEKWEGEPLREPLARYRRVHDAMGIRSLPHLRATLREYLRVVRGAETAKPDPIKQAERALVGVQLEGYVPTPRELAERVIDAAGVTEGVTVLEPSAGKGSLADAAREAGGVVSVVEPREVLRRVLEAKGHQLIGRDALEVEGIFDRVVMNPPFEQGQDMVHVRRAYEENLAPGGRLVAITSEGPFFRGDKQATEFRAWLESVGGASERLPAGSFRGSDVPTDVATRLVVIDKPKTGGRA
jgi:hypothetical protein